MEAWDVVLVGSGLATHRAASQSAKNKANTLMLSIDDIGTGDAVGIDGIAAPLQEPSPKYTQTIPSLVEIISLTKILFTVV